MIVQWDKESQTRLAGEIEKQAPGQLISLEFCKTPSDWFKLNSSRFGSNVLLKAFANVFSIPREPFQFDAFLTGTAGQLVDSKNQEVFILEPSLFDFDQSLPTPKLTLGERGISQGNSELSDAVTQCYHEYYINSKNKNAQTITSIFRNGEMLAGFGAVDVSVGEVPGFLSPYTQDETSVFHCKTDWLTTTKEFARKLLKTSHQEFSRRLFIFSGHSSEIIYEQLNKNPKPDSNYILLNEREILSGKLLTALSVGTGPVFICMSSPSIVDIILRLKAAIPLDTIIQHWNSHFTDLVVPRLCSSCKVRANRNFSWKSLSISISESEGLHMKGLGCEACLNGYIGTTVLTESSAGGSSAFKFMSVLAENEKSKTINGYSSPHKIIDEIIQDSSFKLLSKAVEESLKHGDIQVSDLYGILF